MRFDFATAPRILFAAGAIRDVPAAARALGASAILVRGASPRHSAPLRAALEAAGVEFIPENGGGAGVRLRKAKAGNESEP